MRRDRITRGLPAIGLGLALSYSTTGLAQGLTPSTRSGSGRPSQGAADQRRFQGPTPNTGSGSGTGTGMSSGFTGSTGTGRESSTGLGTTGTGMEGITTSPLPRTYPNPNLTRPIDRGGIPGLEGFGNAPGGLSTVSPDLFLDARSVTDPGERALALIRIAETAIFSKQLDDAHTALFEAGPAALSARDRLIREQRLTAIVTALLSLAEERVNTYAEVDTPPLDDPRAPAPPTRAPSSPGDLPPPRLRRRPLGRRSPHFPRIPSGPGSRPPSRNGPRRSLSPGRLT